MNVKEFKDKLSKFPNSIHVYMQSSWSISGKYYSGFIPVQGITSGIPVKSLKNGLLEEFKSSKRHIIVLESGSPVITIHGLRWLLEQTPNAWLVTTHLFVVGPKQFVGFEESEYEFKVSGIKKQKKYKMYDENPVGRKKVLLLKE